MDYGREMLGNGPLGFAPRLMARVGSSTQRCLMDSFAQMVRRGVLDAPFARVGRTIVGPFLYGLKLEVNSTCTLRCRMCYVERTGRELPRAALDRLFESLRGAGVRIEFLGGEPLLRTDLAELVARAKRVARAPFVSLYTNGVHADAARSAALADAGLDAALVSLISAREGPHDDFVGQAGAWQRTLRGIEELQRAGIPVYTFTTVHRENLEQVPEIAQFVRNELGAHPTFYQYIPQHKQDPLALLPVEWDEKKRYVVRQNPEHMDFVRCFYLLTGSACSGGNLMLTVKVDGRVTPCPFVSDIPLGNILEQELWTIYRHRYQGTRLREFKCCPSTCEPCAYRSVCAGGCRAAEGILRGRYDVADHRCLGPFPPPFEREKVLDHIPTFF